MVQQAFDLIAEKLGAALAVQEMKRQGTLLETDEGEMLLFTGETIAYSVLYDEKGKRFQLRTASMTEDGPDDNWKTLSTWLYDPEQDSLSQVEDIAGDFVHTIEGPKRLAAVQQTKKKRKKDEDNTTDPIFFFNRLATIFPKLRDEMTQERNRYGEIRAVTFAREHIVSKVEAMAKDYPGSEPFEKMCTVFNDLYQTGDMSTRSIITMVILNGIEDAGALEKIEERFSTDLAKSYKCGRRMKGKKVKPEKKKKPSKFMAQTLNEMKR